MKKNNNKQEQKTIRIKGEDRVTVLNDLIRFVSDASGIDVDYTGAINWVLKQFDEDKITFNV
jgi:hypothetical protein